MSESESLVEIGQGTSDDPNPQRAGTQAARAAMASIRRFRLTLALVYAAEHYDLQEVLKGIRTVVRDTPIIGTTTAGALHGRIHSRAILVVAIASPHLEVHAAIGHGVSANWRGALQSATRAHAVRDLVEMRPGVANRLTREGKSLFALLFFPGNTKVATSRGYEILESFKSLTLGRVPVFGGGAADDWRMETSKVILGNEAHADSVLVAMFETRLGFGIALGHGFHASPQHFRVTGTADHEVLTLDNQAAGSAIAGSLGTSSGEIGKRHLTLTYGRVFGTPDPLDQYSVNVATYLTSTGGVRLTQPVPPGAELTIMEVDPEFTPHAGANVVLKALIRAGTERPALVIAHYCALRPRLLGDPLAALEIEGMGEATGGAPLVGYVSFGEVGLGDDGVSRHNNAAVSVLALAATLSQPGRVAAENERLREAVRQQTNSRLSRYDQEIRRSERILRTITNNIPSLISLLDTDLRFRYANSTYREWLGVEPESLLGRSLGDVYGTEVFSRVQGYFQKALRGETVEYARTMITADGLTRHVSVWVVPSLGENARVDSLIVLINDLTRGFETEQALRRSEQRLSLALECGEMGTWELNVDTGVEHWNDRTYELLGIDRNEIPTLDLFLTRVHPEDRARVMAQTSAVVANESKIDVEFRVTLPDGTQRWILSKALGQYDANGRCVRVTGLNQDVTSQRRLQRALVEAEAARHANLAKSEFLSQMSHELRTPLNAVLGFAQLLGADPENSLSNTQKRRLTHIERAGEHLLQMVDGVLNLSAIDTGQLRLQIDAVRPWEVLKEARDMIAVDAERKQVALRFDEARGREITVLADRTRLRQCLVNLLSNAVKFNRPDGWVAVDVTRIADEVAIGIHDSGRGIPPEQIKHLFEPFNRLGAEKTPVRGTGIGLSVTRRLVEAMAGRIEVESVLDEGTRFTVYLPHP